MSSDEVIRLIFSLLGGGLVAGLLNLWNSNRLERKRKRIEFIRLQLQDLYGSLQFLTSSNAQLLHLTRKLNEAYTAEYIEKKWSDNPITQERVGQQTTETLAISNEYIKQLVENNGHILEVLTNHYSLIDPEDTEVFAQFIVDYTRYKTEFGEKGLRTPIGIYTHVGEISFIRQEFIDAVDKRFKEKQSELRNLLN